MYDRKCDLVECNSTSPLWRIFRGCGHSVHIECNLPNISVCVICQSTIKSKIQTLSKTANDAVTNLAKEDDAKEESDDDRENSDDDDDLNSDEDNSIEETSIDDLISRIGSWAHIVPPRN